MCCDVTGFRCNELPALPSLQIDADDTIAKQIVSGTVPAVEVRRGVFHRQINKAEVFVRGDERPHAGVAVDRPRIVLPGVIADLTGDWPALTDKMITDLILVVCIYCAFTGAASMSLRSSMHKSQQGLAKLTAFREKRMNNARKSLGVPLDAAGRGIAGGRLAAGLADDAEVEPSGVQTGAA